MVVGIVTGHAKYADTDLTVYDASCPYCATPLEWAVETPPIPMTLFSWFDPEGEGARVQDCPGCGHWLPEGDLR